MGSRSGSDDFCVDVDAFDSGLLAGFGKPVPNFVDEGLTSAELSLSRRGLRPVVLLAVVVAVAAVVVVGALVAAAAFALVVRAGKVEAV